MKGWTHGFCYVHVRRGNFLALLASYFNFSHIPNAKSCAAQLRPNFTPAVVFVRLGAIWVPVELVNEGAREIDFPRVRYNKRDDGADFRVKGGLISR